MSTENRCSLLVLCLDEGLLYSSHMQPTPPQIRSGMKGVASPISRYKAEDTNQQTSQVNLPSRKIPKARRTSSNPDIDPVGSMEHPAQSENFIRGELIRLPARSPNSTVPYVA